MRIYDTPQWKAVRLEILARDGYRCQIRLPKCSGRATQVDHIVNVSEGGAALNPSNLQAACRSCNIAKRNRQLADAARRERGEEPATRTTVQLPPHPSDPFLDVIRIDGRPYDVPKNMPPGIYEWRDERGRLWRRDPTGTPNRVTDW